MRLFLFLSALSYLTYFILELTRDDAPKIQFVEEVSINSHRNKRRQIKLKKNHITSSYKNLKRPLRKKTKIKVTTIKQAGPKVNWDNVDTLEQLGEAHFVNVQVVDGQEVVHGDVLIPKNTEKVGKKILLAKPRLWRNGYIPYKVDKSLSNYSEIISAINYMNQETNIKFVPYTDQKDYVSVISGKDNCYSGVGRHGGEQFITLSPNCNEGAIIHELVHTIGFFHEQNRFDRDEFIEIFWGNIEKKFWPQFKKIPKAATLTADTPFDMKSIMLYPPNFFALNTSFATIGTVDGELYQPESDRLSYWDKEEINLLYPLN